MSIDIDDILRCPVTGSPLKRVADHFVSAEGRRYPVIQDVPVLLAPRERSTLWVADASIRSAATDPSSEWHEDTIGVSPAELAELKCRLKRGDEDPASVDPVISFLIRDTSGYMYSEQVGRLKTIPIPVLRLPRSSGGQFLLDVGCNWGRWSIAAARLGYNVVGVDPSLGAVLAAKRLARDMGIQNVHFVVGDALQLPFADDMFDCVFSYSVIQHFSTEDAIAAIKQAARVSKRDGHMLVQMPNRFGVRCLYHQWRRRFQPPRGFDVRYYSPLMLKRMFSYYYGDAVISVDGFFGLGIQPSDRHLMPRRKKAVIDASEFLRALSKRLTPLALVADSLYVNAIRGKGSEGKDGAEPEIRAF